MTTTTATAEPQWVNINLAEDFHCGKREIDAIYELIANAIDANGGGKPSVIVDDTEVRIIDKGTGSGIVPNNFVLGRKIEDNIASIGQHGIGMKEACAILKRNGLSIEIESRGKKYEFSVHSAMEGLAPTLHFKTTNVAVNPEFSTRVVIRGWQSKQQAEIIVKEAKSYFLIFIDNLQSKKKDEENGIERYHRDSEQVINYFYVHGARVQTPTNLIGLYNFTKLSSEERNAIGTNHVVEPDKRSFFLERIKAMVRKYFANEIHHAGCEFHMNNPVTVYRPNSTPSRALVPNPPLSPTPVQPPAAPAIKIIIDENFERHLVNSISHELQTTQDSTVFSLSKAERNRAVTIAQELDTEIKKIEGLNVAEIKRSGSIKKHTAVPGYADVDLVLLLNDFQIGKVESGEYKQLITDALTVIGVDFLSSGNDIFPCIYKGIEIDLVITAKDENFLNTHRRYKDFADPVCGSSFIKGLIPRDSDWVYEVIRAAKYWTKRHPTDHEKRLKSMAVELIVVELFLQGNLPNSEKKVELFKRFLKFVGDTKNATDASHLPIRKLPEEHKVIVSNQFEFIKLYAEFVPEE